MPYCARGRAMADRTRQKQWFWHPEGIRWPASVAYSVLSRSGVFRQHYGRVAQEAARRVQSGRVLDVGTGPGWLLVALRQHIPGAELVGADISAAMVREAVRNLASAGCAERVEVRCADAASLPFAERSFDLVLSTGSLHHWRDRVAGLDEVWRVLKPGGCALVYDVVRHLPREVRRGLRERLGGVRLALWWLHSLAEPLLDSEGLLTLARETRSGSDATHFTGGICCLELRKGAAC